VSNEPRDPAATNPSPTRVAPPDVTTDLPAPASAEDDTSRHGDTSVSRDTPADTATYRGAGASFDPARTGLHTPSHEPEPDAARDAPTLAGYEIIAELGRGGMGVVYKARQLGLNRVVALKMILAGPHADGGAINRFLAEARAVARFQHPNIVQVFEVAQFDGLPYFSLEFVEGGTLGKKIAREPQPPKYAAETVEQLARAMQYAHDRGIVHRDLKPANILLAPDGTPKITDFGLAKSLEGDSGQTQSGQVLGTPSYMAPEQARGEVEHVGPAADVYALGAILYDLLTGRPPFAGSSVLDTLEMVRNREPVPPSQLTAKLPRDLETICLKCLQKDAAKRYASAGDLADDLRRFLDGRPIVVRPVGKVEKAWRWAKRNPVGALAALLGLAVVIVPSVLSVLLFQAKTFAQGEQKKAEDALAAEKQALIDKENARAAEEVAKKEAIENLNLAAKQRDGALNAFRGVLFRVDPVLRSKASLAPVRRDVIDVILRDFRVITDEASLKLKRNLLEDRTEAVAYSRIGDIYFQAGEVKEAAVWREKAYPILKKVADENPNDPAALFNLSSASNLLADVEWRFGNGPKARGLYADALELRLKRVPLIEAMVKDGKAQDLDLLRARYALAESYSLVAFADLRLGNPASAVENYLASDKAFADLPPRTSRSLPVRRIRAEIQVRLGDARLRQNRPDEAEKHYRAALDERLALLKDTPPPKPESPLKEAIEQARLTIKGDIAQSRLYLGDYFLTVRGDVTTATVEYRLAFDLFAELLKNEPDRLDYRQRVAATHYRLGYAAGKSPTVHALVGAGHAVKHYGECLRLREELAKIDPKDAPAKVELMLALARLGRAAEAEKRAGELLTLTRETPDPQVLFQTAAGLAVAAGGASDSVVATRCRDKAFEVLNELVKHGWKSGAALELDPDLESLRDDPRFAKVLAALSPPREK
jgi:serine/threonine-protein kinase